MRRRKTHSKEKSFLKGFTRMTLFFQEKQFQKKEEVLEALTLCSPQNRSLANIESLKLSFNNMARPKDILGESIRSGFANILGNDGLSVDYDNFHETSYLQKDTDDMDDSPTRLRKNSNVNGLNQKSGYFTYGDQLENQFNRK